MSARSPSTFAAVRSTAAARWSLTASGAALLLGGSAFLGLAHPSYPTWVWTIVAVAVISGALVAAAAWSWQSCQQPLDARWLIGVGCVAVLARALLMPAPYMLSDDAARYHWDGKVVANGGNPYELPPASAELDGLRTDALDERINHPNVITCYPPLAQGLFAVGYLLTPGRLVGLQVLFLLAEIATVGILWWRFPESRGWLLLLIWSPLLIFEGYLPGHSDLLGLPFLTLFIVAAVHRRPFAAGIGLALACLIKPLPLVMAPAALRRFGVAGSVRCALTVLVVWCVAYLPFLSAGSDLFTSTTLMAEQWAFNGTVTELLEMVVAPTSARLLAAGLLALMVVGGVAFGRDLIARWLLAMAAVVVCSPVLFPWYLIWLVPLLVLRPDPALLAVTVLIPITEVVTIQWVAEGIWAPSILATTATFVPFYALLALGALRRWGMFAPAERTA